MFSSILNLNCLCDRIQTLGGGNMKSKQTKIFDINGVGYQFDKSSFKRFVKSYMHREGIRQCKVFELISSDINVTPEAVKQWYYGKFLGTAQEQTQYPHFYRGACQRG